MDPGLHSPASSNPSNRRLFQSALVCALLPMTLGVTMVVGYWLTYSGLFIVGGLILLLSGPLVLLIGWIGLRTWTQRERRIVHAGVPRSARRIERLLFLNIPM